MNDARGVVELWSLHSPVLGRHLLKEALGEVLGEYEWAHQDTRKVTSLCIVPVVPPGASGTGCEHGHHPVATARIGKRTAATVVLRDANCKVCDESTSGEVAILEARIELYFYESARKSVQSVFIVDGEWLHIYRVAGRGSKRSLRCVPTARELH
ncbi:MAG: hypothetical protein AAF436_02460 [Myxococcota bacterium]